MAIQLETLKTCHPGRYEREQCARVEGILKTKPRPQPGLSQNRGKLFYLGHSGAQARFIPGRGVLVDYAFFHRFIDHGDGAAEGLFGLAGVTGGQRLPKLAQLRPQT
jgi:hypothetical protein